MKGMFRPIARYQRITDYALAAVFFLAMAPLSQLSTQAGIGIIAGPLWLRVLAVTIMMSIALAFRRHSPALALAIAWAGAVLQMALLLPPLLSNIAIFGVLYTTAAYGGKRTRRFGLISVFLGAFAVTAYLAGPYVSEVMGEDSRAYLQMAVILAAAAILAFALAWVSGLLARSLLRGREVEQQKALAEAMAVVEQERNQIARDMHDVVAHSLAVVIAQSDGARYAAAANPEAATDALKTIGTTARAALADVRLLLGQLRHSQAEGPQPTLTDLESLYAHVRSSGVDLSVDVDPAPQSEPPASVQLAIYRILQESLTNALRHADGAPVKVVQRWLSDRVELSVSNHVAHDSEVKAGGHGLVGMRERAQLVGGTLEAGLEDDTFLVRSTIPLELPE